MASAEKFGLGDLLWPVEVDDGLPIGSSDLGRDNSNRAQALKLTDVSPECAAAVHQTAVACMIIDLLIQPCKLYFFLI